MKRTASLAMVLIIAFIDDLTGGQLVDSTLPTNPVQPGEHH